MLACKHLHYLYSAGPLAEIDVYATTLAVYSRGAYTIYRDLMRVERDRLAAILDGGCLAELLLSERPIRVLAISTAYVIEEV